MSKTTHPHFKQRIRELVELGYTAPDIRKILETQTPENLFDDLPSLRTIQRYYKQLSSQRSDDWKITDCDNPEDARFVLDALCELFAWYEHIERPRISIELADMIIRVYKIAPDMPRTAKVKIAIMLLLGEHLNEVYDLLAYLPYVVLNYRAYIRHTRIAYEDFEAHTIFKKIYFQADSTFVEVWDFDLSFTLENAPDWIKDKNPFYDLDEGTANPDYPNNFDTDFDNKNIKRLFVLGSG